MLCDGYTKTAEELIIGLWLFGSLLGLLTMAYMAHAITGMLRAWSRQTRRSGIVRLRRWRHASFSAHQLRAFGRRSRGLAPRWHRWRVADGRSWG